MILDVEALSKHCHACSRKGHLDPTSPEFLDWREGHQAVCCINYTGSSNAMEKDGVVRIWERSVEKYKLRYTSMISDADSSTYPNLRDASPYGNDHPISIHACIGHFQKSMFKHLETIKKKVHLDAEGKRVRIGGKGRKERMLQLQKYYGKGICSNVGDLVKWGLYLKPPKFEHICSRHNFPPFSSVQIIIIPACCLLCVLKICKKKSLYRHLFLTRKGHSLPNLWQA